MLLISTQCALCNITTTGGQYSKFRDPAAKSRRCPGLNKKIGVIRDVPYPSFYTNLGLLSASFIQGRFNSYQYKRSTYFIQCYLDLSLISLSDLLAGNQVLLVGVCSFHSYEQFNITYLIV